MTRIDMERACNSLSRSVAVQLCPVCRCLQYGLYGSFLGCLLYIFLGSCKDVPMGPTAITALLVYQTVSGRGAEFAVLLCFLTGIVQLLMGILGLGE